MTYISGRNVSAYIYYGDANPHNRADTRNVLTHNDLKQKQNKIMNKRNLLAEEYTAPELDTIAVNAEFGVIVSTDEGDIENAHSWDYGEF